MAPFELHKKNFTDDRGFSQIWPDKHSTRVRAARRCSWIAQELERNRSRSILDVGCGKGTLSFRLAQETGAKVLGTDLCVSFIDEARRNFQMPNLRFEAWDFYRVEQFANETFDGIVGDGILHHLYHHLDQAFENMRRLLNPGGKVVFLEPNLSNPYAYLIFTYPYLRKMARLEPDEMAFSRAFVIGALTRAGFRNIRVEYRDFLLPGVPALLVEPSILAGAILEKIPFVSRFSQSLFISAVK